MDIYCVFSRYCDEPLLTAVCINVFELKNIMNETFDCDDITVLRLKSGEHNIVSQGFDQTCDQKSYLFRGSLDYIRNTIKSNTFDITKTYFEDEDDYKYIGKDAIGSEEEESDEESDKE